MEKMIKDAFSEIKLEVLSVGEWVRDREVNVDDLSASK